MYWFDFIFTMLIFSTVFIRKVEGFVAVEPINSLLTPETQIWATDFSDVISVIFKYVID